MGTGPSAGLLSYFFPCMSPKEQYSWPQDQIGGLVLCAIICSNAFYLLCCFIFGSITFLFSGLFFPEFLIAFFFLFEQRKLGLCHHVPMI